MPSPGDARSGADALHTARERERAGRIPQAIDGYEAAIVAAERAGDAIVLAEALRRLAILRRHRDEPTQARELCLRSYDVARGIGHEQHLIPAWLYLTGYLIVAPLLVYWPTHFVLWRWVRKGGKH